MRIEFDEGSSDKVLSSGLRYIFFAMLQPAASEVPQQHLMQCPQCILHLLPMVPLWAQHFVSSQLRVCVSLCLSLMRMPVCEGLAVRATLGVWCSRGAVSSSLRLDRLSLGMSCDKILSCESRFSASMCCNLRVRYYIGKAMMLMRPYVRQSVAALCLVCLHVARFALTVDWNCCRGRSVRPSGMRSTITNHRMEMD